MIHMKMPCEIIIWYILPAIRKEIINELVKDDAISQNRAARMLGITPAAASQYKSAKRGKWPIDDETILNEIANAAKRIARDDDQPQVSDEICKICMKIRKRGLMNEFFQDNKEFNCP